MSEKKQLNWQAFPIALFVVAAYLLMGFLGNLWHPGWLIFVAIPLYHWTVDIITHRRIQGLAVFLSVVISVVVYLAIGFGINKWHPTWIIFFLVPITASMEAFLTGGVKAKVQRLGERVASHWRDDDDDDDDHADIHMSADHD